MFCWKHCHVYSLFFFAFQNEIAKLLFRQWLFVEANCSKTIVFRKTQLRVAGNQYCCTIFNVSVCHSNLNPIWGYISQTWLAHTPQSCLKEKGYNGIVDTSTKFTFKSKWSTAFGTSIMFAPLLFTWIYWAMPWFWTEWSKQLLATDLRNFGAIENDYLRQLQVLIAKDVSICEPYSNVHDECMLMLLYSCWYIDIYIWYMIYRMNVDVDCILFNLRYPWPLFHPISSWWPWNLWLGNHVDIRHRYRSDRGDLHHLPSSSGYHMAAGALFLYVDAIMTSEGISWYKR